MLYGRDSERKVLDRLLDDARGGRSGALVVCGEPGIGKTALLEYAVESASDFSIVRAVGVESEMEIAFAAVQQLCAPMLDRLEHIPSPQRDALSTAFGLRTGPPPDRFLVGLAVLSLLAEAAAEHPLICVVDDAQWLDLASAQAMAFVARRVLAESVVLIFATREPSGEFRGLTELVLQGLPDGDAGRLLASVLPGPLDERVRDRFLAEVRGNPLALLELSRGLSPAQLAGGFGLPRAALSMSARIEENFRQRLASLPEDTQRLLLVASAEPAGDPALLWRAATQLAVPRSALELARTAGLLEIGVRVRFRHPLVRSAVYRAASPEERREVHRALADATDPERDPDRRAWHLAEATAGPDEHVAAELERAAGRAQPRGGLAAAAAFLERATALTVEPSRRAERALAAAQAKHLAGAPDAALELLAIAEAGPLHGLGRARVDTLRAQIAFAQNRGRDAAGLLLRAARRLEPLDAALARDSYLDALSAALYLGHLASGGGVVEVSQAILAAPKPSPPSASDLLLEGFATRFTDGYARSAPILRRGLAAVPSDDVQSEQPLRWLWLAFYAAVNLWDDQTWEAMSSRYVRVARETGALTVLPLALNGRVAVHTLAGELAAAASLIEEARAVGEATGSQLPPYGAVILAGWRGREMEASGVIEATIDEALIRGEAYALSTAEWARSVLYNGLGRYEDALAAAKRATEHPEHLLGNNSGLVELIESGVRSGDVDHAVDALRRLSDITDASGTDWALGLMARSAALLNDGDAAETLYRDAIDRLQRTRIRVHLARAHLLYGEWLRRERRRLDAREQLRIAHEMFTAMGMEAFGDRAERELVATGERARKRTVETREELTAQEAQIARLARGGLSNPEIAARLFISPRTVEYHLHKIFIKLGIGSRHQLQDALHGDANLGLAG